MLGDAIGQIPLEVVPDSLIRIEFRGVSRKGIEMDAGISAEHLFDFRAFMGGAAIPQQYNMPPEMAEKLPEEPRDQRGTDVFVVKTGIKSESFPFRGNRDGGYCRDFCPAAGDSKNRGLSPRRPCSADMGNEEKAAFVEECDMRFKLSGVFLYAATHTASSGRWLLRFSPGLVSEASEDSSPKKTSGAIHVPHDTARQSDCESPGRYASGSTDPWRSPCLRGSWTEFAPVSVSGFQKACMGVPEPVWASALSVLSSGRSAANVQQSLANSSVWPPQNGSLDRIAVGRRLSACAFPTVGGFHRVSCPIG